MNLSQLELHDANLLSVSFDAAAQTADIAVAYYVNEQSSERVFGILRFTDVVYFNQIVDFDLLKKHSGAGNIVQWITGEVPCTSYLYLARGLIVVKSASVDLVVGA